MFFKKISLAIDISDYSIEVISLEGSIENPRLLAMGRTVLEPGIFENGKILGKEELKKNLQNLIENPKFGQIKTNKIILALPESKSYIHIFELPKNLKRSEVIEFAKSQAVQTFPHPLADLYFDFQIQNNEVLLIAAPKKIVNDYLEVFKDCNLIPVALEIESLSLARVLIEKEKTPVLIVDIGARTTNLSIFDPPPKFGEGGLRLSFSLPVAGNRFSQALSEKLNVPQKAAESLKKEIGLDPKYQEGRVFLILQKEIQGIIEEINKIEEYFGIKTGKNIEKIILAGGSAALPRLSEYLAENLEKPVAIGDPWVKINIDILKKKEYFEKALEVNPILYSTVIGVALRGLSKNPERAGINLLPTKGR